EPGLIEAPLDGSEWKAGVVLAARQTLFLYGTDGHAVDDECGGRVVVVRGDAENLHVSTGWWASRRRARSAAIPAARAVRHAWRPTRTAGARRNRQPSASR